MIAALKSLFHRSDDDTEESDQQSLNLVAAALLIETARANFSYDEVEHETLLRLLCKTLKLDHNQVEELVATAETRVDNATSLYEFTREINDHYSPAQKIQLLQNMWKVAYADGTLGKYEEHLIRQVAELTYVPHEDYIRSKLAAQKYMREAS